MYTEDDLGRELRDGSMSVEAALDAFAADQVLVYAAMNLTEGEETWQDVEDLGAGSTLFSDLHFAGATPVQMDAVGAQIERARSEGRTLDQVYGWGTTEEAAGDDSD